MRSGGHRRVTSLLVGVVGLVTLAGCSAGDDAPSATPDQQTATSTTAPSGPTEPSPTESTPIGSPGCGVAPDVEAISDDLPGDREQVLAVGDVERTYRLAVPVDHDPDQPTALVLNLHGSGSNALQASIYSDLPRAATERGMLVAAPDAIDGVWELGSDGADAEFLEALLDDLEHRYCVDPDRIHLLGFSLGAWKAAVTACTLDGRVASLALLTVEVFPGECPPMPMIAFHGTADATVAYGRGGGTIDADVTPNAGLPGALDNLAAWAASAECEPEPTVTPIGADVELRRHTDCEDGVEVALYTIVGGGHTWPGSEVVLGPPELTTDTIDATSLVLDWFEAHPRRA